VAVRRVCSSACRKKLGLMARLSGAATCIRGGSLDPTGLVSGWRFPQLHHVTTCCCRAEGVPAPWPRPRAHIPATQPSVARCRPRAFRQKGAHRGPPRRGDQRQTLVTNRRLVTIDSPTVAMCRTQPVTARNRSPTHTRTHHTQVATPCHTWANAWLGEPFRGHLRARHTPRQAQRVRRPSNAP
jgi:hypothetical protein